MVALLPPPDPAGVEPGEDDMSPEIADPESEAEPGVGEVSPLDDVSSLLDADDVGVSAADVDESVELVGDAGVDELEHPPAASRTAAAQTMSRAGFMVFSWKLASGANG